MENVLLDAWSCSSSVEVARVDRADHGRQRLEAGWLGVARQLRGTVEDWRWMVDAVRRETVGEAMSLVQATVSACRVDLWRSTGGHFDGDRARATAACGGTGAV